MTLDIGFIQIVLLKRIFRLQIGECFKSNYILIFQRTFNRMQVTRGLDLMYLLATYLLLTEGVTGIPLNEFYPFGVEAGDTLVPRTDDGSSPAITLPRQFYFFGQFTNTIYVSFKHAAAIIV